MEVKMKGLMGCLGLLIGVPLALAAVCFVGGTVAFLIYALFNIILYFLPLLVLAALVCFLACAAYQVWKALNN